jgi:hypothetical protein
MANGADNRIPGGVIDPNSIMTLPRLLKEQAGYRTALIGKWHVTTPERGVRRPDATPLEDLFTDAIYDNDCCRGSFNRRPLKCLSDGSRNDGLCIAGGAWDDWEGPARLGLEAKCNQPNVPVVNGHTVDCHFSPRGYADMADEYLEKMRLSGENFFLTVAFNATHDPHQSPQRSKRHYEAAPQTERQANFWGLLEETDAAIGRILDALVRTGLDENTVVLFTNDQGPDGIAPRFGDPRLLSGKRTVLEGGIRVPFLAVPPGALQNPAAGPKYVDRLASHVDVYRTVATLAGIDSSDPRVVDTDGVDLSGTILDGDPPTREAVFSRYVGKIAAITEPEFFQSLAASAAGAGRDSQTPSDLLGVCAYAPDPTTLDGNEIQNASGGECPGVVSEGTESKLSHCAVAPRGASVKLCSDDAACAGTMCRITGLRCIPSGSSPQRTAEDLAIRPRCIGGGDCRPNEDCVAVETPCNRCVTPKWKAIREVVHAVPTVRDVVSNPEEDPALDFVGIQAFLQNPPCKISYLRDTMRCLLEKYLDCEVRDPEACENGSFPKMPGPMSIEAFAGCTMPPLDCE